MVLFLPTFFIFRTALLNHVLFCAEMARKKNKFVEEARAARKGKAVAKTSGPPPKRARRVEEIIIALPPSYTCN